MEDNFVYFDRDWTLPLTYDVYDGVTYPERMEYSAGPEDDNEDGKLGESYYREQWTYIKHLVQSCDITSDEVYEEFCSLVDVDNFIDYTIVYLYSANDDWPGNNFRLWRVTEEDVDPTVYGADGKWRFMVHDFDIAFESADHNTLYLSTMQKDDNSLARHPKFATDFYECLLKNEKFRNELAQRTMVYLRTIWSGTDIYNIVNELVAEREAGKTADVKRWSLGTLDGWKRNTTSLSNFGGSRPAKLRSQYMDVLNTNYNAGITGVVLFNMKGDDCYISGGKVQSGDELKMFSGIPVTIKAENSYISVTENGSLTEAYELLSFTPSADCEIQITKVEGIVSASIENGRITVDVATADGKLYVAGFDKDDMVKFVVSADIVDSDFEVENADYYKLFVWESMTPLGGSVKLVPEYDTEENSDGNIQINVNVSDENDNLLKDPYEDNYDSQAEAMK